MEERKNKGEHWTKDSSIFVTSPTLHLARNILLLEPTARDH